MDRVVRLLEVDENMEAVFGKLHILLERLSDGKYVVDRALRILKS